MKCVITGGSGFIGSYIAEELAREENEVYILDIRDPEIKLKKNMHHIKGSTMDIDLLRDLFNNTEEVYDMAGIIGTSELIFNNREAVINNILGSINVLETAKGKKVKKIMYPSKPNVWLNTYTITKQACEQFCQMFNSIHNMDITILKIFEAYGPRQKMKNYRKVIPYFITQALKNEPLEVYGNGEQHIDLIYVNDLAKIIIQATRNNKKINKVLDCGSGNPITVNELAKKIIKLTNSKSEILHVKMRLGEEPETRLKANTKDLNIDTNKLTSLDDGLMETINYYKNSNNIIRATLTN